MQTKKTKKNQPGEINGQFSKSATIEGLHKKAAAKINTHSFFFIEDGSPSMGRLFEAVEDAGKQTIEKLAKRAGAPPACLQTVFTDTNLAPSIDALTDEISSRKVAHLLILSDGETFDNGNAKLELQELKSINPKLTVDAIVITDGFRRPTSLETLFENIRNDASFSNSSPRVLVVQPEGVAAAASSLLALRLREVHPRVSKELSLT